MVDFATNPIFTDAPVAYSVVDAGGQQVAANRRFWELFGYEPGTALTVEDLTHHEHLEQTEEYLDALSGDSSELISAEKQYVRADGTPFWGRLTARRIQDNTGAALLLGIIENIDEQRRLEAGLRDAAVLQSEFVAQVSHEIRNPLHTIAGMAELLAGAELEPQHRQQAEAILREATGLTSIVSDLLDIGRIDAGNFAVDNVPFAARSLIDRAVRVSQTAAAAKALRLNVNIDDAVPINVMGDPRRVGQVLDNLVGNAIKFTAHGSVTLDVAVSDSAGVVFRVEDTGPGIPAEFMDNLYEPFERVNESTSGAGLGLAISRRLAESMGGSLSVIETGVEGTTFELDLPLEDAGDHAGVPNPALPTGALQASRILVVEDNPETQMLASAQLERLGYQHDLVGDGYQALEYFDNERYGAVLMDWHLPGMDGLETTRRIRQHEARTGQERTPIISVTARAMAADIEACRQAGADDFVAKPAGINDIAEALDRWVGGGAAVDEVPSASRSELFVALLDDLGDPATVRSLGATFLSELPERIEAIVAQDDDSRVELVAHTLASTSVMFGATELGQTARDIEDTARAGETITDQQRHQLKEVAVATEQAMRAVLDSLEGAT